MIDCVFISDLHLHADEQEIEQRFKHFIAWALQSVRKVYILGDFFNAWVGDDSLNAWSRGIAKQVHALTAKGIEVYYLHGNRDFLLGKTFAKEAGWKLLQEPAFIQLGDERIMLMHGDSYCTLDKAHQRFRKLTRNKLFNFIFLRLPLLWRIQLANKVRAKSMQNTHKSPEEMDVVADSVVSHMVRNNTKLLIHGHTHRYGLTTYQTGEQELKRYVLSDWDTNPQMLCYNRSKGFYYYRLDT